MLGALTPGTNGQILYDSIHLRYLERTNSPTESGIVFTTGWAEEGWGVNVQQQSQFGGIKQFWRWMAVKAARQCECALCH